ncbi:S-methyl-5-thioribose kinase [Neisseriaceae bacterium JH1-16]|nr:S-methyl-5-thioribose kinase [Neisseriaceae bacterium JH1-16]
MAVPTPDGYQILNSDRLITWLASLPDLAARLGGKPADWQVEEVGDGNLNLVFLVRGPTGGLCVKQSLPYVRVVGESWPMPLERAFFEYRHLAETGRHVTGLAPELIHYDAAKFAIVVELLAPHRILRRGLIDGVRYPDAALAVAEYVARTAVQTSVLAESFETVFNRAAVFSRNHALTRVTAELVFADPYHDHPRNSWTSPQLDDLVAEFRQDSRLKLAAARLGHAFLTRREALLHGDLHTGSVMVSDVDTRVIDPEFALYGPVGFDLGAFVANLLTAYFSQAGYVRSEDEQAAYGEWLLSQVAVFWQHFAQRYDQLWQAQTGGDAYPAALFQDPAGQTALALECQQVIASLFADTLGFAGIEIIRRVLGFAHNLEFESIADADLRAGLERQALALARRLLVEPGQFADIDGVIAAARALTQDRVAA